MSYPSNYKYGYIREDGYIFSGWKRRNGKVTPNFRNPKSFKKQDEDSKIRKQIKRLLCLVMRHIVFSKV